MDMPRKILNPLLFLLFGALIAVGLAWLSGDTCDPYAGEKKLVHRVVNFPELDCVVLGNSHASAVQPRDMGFTHGRRMNRPGDDIFELRYKSRYYADEVPTLKTVIIAISFYEFMYDNNLFVKDGVRPRRDKHIMTYASYPALELITDDYDNFMLAHLLPLVTKTHWEPLLGPYLVADQPAPPKRKGGKKPAPTKAYLDRHGPKQARVAVRAVTNMKKNSTGALYSEAVAAAEDMITNLQAKGIRVVLFTPPYWPTYTKAFPPHILKKFQRTMEDIVEKTGVEYYNFATDARFTSDPSQFINSDHLTYNNKRFSKILAKVMKRHERQKASAAN